MATIVQYYLLTLFLINIFLFHIPLTKAGVDFIVNTCKHTQNSGFCVAALESDRRSFNASTVVELAGIAIEIATAAAGSTLSLINDLGGQYPGTAAEEALKQCAQLYGNAIDDLEEARKDVWAGDYSGAAEPVDSAWEAPRSCEDAFADRSLSSPVVAEDKDVDVKCGLCFDLVDLLNS
uniref:Pectinesterase inhibitor domain-containing protein n=1 Tax=Ananas comosus var. bracteatus TaxID=296719 RepID=A0A6V7QIX6_ANACO|nr:unnamed protein product [Ananas comosus var. bracteatus]